MRILNPVVSEFRIFANSSHQLFVIVATHLPTSKDGNLRFGCLLSVAGVERRASGMY